MQMVESLKELNRICQKPRYKEVGNWMVRHMVRDAALPVTWLLLHTNISANQVTLASLIIAMSGALCLFGIPKGFFLLGAILLELWYFLDHVDGQIARYRKAASLTGRFFDFLTHHIVHGSVFFGLGIYCFRETGVFLFILWAFIASIGITVFNLIHDVKYKTFFERLIETKRVEIKEPANLEEGAVSEKKHIPKRFFSLIHKASEIHVVMNVLALAAVLEMAWGVPIALRFWLFLAYGTFAPFLAVTKIAYLIRTRSIDREYEGLFRES